MFARATRMKLTFKTSKGMVFTQDLWGLSLEELAEMATAYRNKLQSDEDNDFLRSKTKQDKTIKLMFDIVKYIIDTFLDERDEATTEIAKKQEQQVLLKALEKKQQADLENLSVQELKDKLDSL